MWPYLLTIGIGIVLLALAIIYAKLRNAGRDRPADIARTEHAAHRVREETDRDDTD